MSPRYNSFTGGQLRIARCEVFLLLVLSPTAWAVQPNGEALTEDGSHISQLEFQPIQVNLAENSDQPSCVSTAETTIKIHSLSPEFCPFGCLGYPKVIKAWLELRRDSGQGSLVSQNTKWELEETERKSEHYGAGADRDLLKVTYKPKGGQIIDLSGVSLEAGANYFWVVKTDLSDGKFDYKSYPMEQGGGRGGTGENGKYPVVSNLQLNGVNDLYTCVGNKITVTAEIDGPHSMTCELSIPNYIQLDSWDCSPGAVSRDIVIPDLEGLYTVALTVHSGCNQCAYAKAAVPLLMSKYLPEIELRESHDYVCQEGPITLTGGVDFYDNRSTCEIETPSGRRSIPCEDFYKYDFNTLFGVTQAPAELGVHRYGIRVTNACGTQEKMLDVNVRERPRISNVTVNGTGGPLAVPLWLQKGQRFQFDLSYEVTGSEGLVHRSQFAAYRYGPGTFTRTARYYNDPASSVVVGNWYRWWLFEDIWVEAWDEQCGISPIDAAVQTYPVIPSDAGAATFVQLGSDMIDPATNLNPVIKKSTALAAIPSSDLPQPSKPRPPIAALAQVPDVSQKLVRSSAGPSTPRIRDFRINGNGEQNVHLCLSESVLTLTADIDGPSQMMCGLEWVGGYTEWMCEPGSISHQVQLNTREGYFGNVEFSVRDANKCGATAWDFRRIDFHKPLNVTLHSPLEYFCQDGPTQITSSIDGFTNGRDSCLAIGPNGEEKAIDCYRASNGDIKYESVFPANQVGTYNLTLRAQNVCGATETTLTRDVKPKPAINNLMINGSSVGTYITFENDLSISATLQGSSEMHYSIQPLNRNRFPPFSGNHFYPQSSGLTGPGSFELSFDANPYGFSALFLDWGWGWWWTYWYEAGGVSDFGYRYPYAFNSNAVWIKLSDNKCACSVTSSLRRPTLALASLAFAEQSYQSNAGINGGGPIFELMLGEPPMAAALNSEPMPAPIHVTFFFGIEKKIEPMGDNAYHISYPFVTTGKSPTLFWYDPAAAAWLAVPDQKQFQETLFARLTRKGLYQIATHNPSPSFEIGDVYVFPNPAKNGNPSVLHIEANHAEEVTARIYDAANDLVMETRIDEGPVFSNGNFAYEKELKIDRSGSFSGMVTIVQEGGKKVNKAFTFTVIK